MSLPKGRHVTYEEFEEMRKESEQLMEYIDGIVYMAPSPNTEHQRISMKLSAMLFNLLQDKDCEVLAAPYDIELVDKESDERKVVIPDLSVICDKRFFTDQKYVGIPDLIIEIISPSNQSHDLIFKTNLYQKYGVKEYWIINPILDNIMVYSLGEDKQYRLIENEKRGVVKSRIIDDFEVDVELLFK
ncbi:Uma2 family endonuclease [Bacillus niameyensis]|uniref:Uma2 family endonuclease n=1 Tax=Bacillus niameyensis TaxID=1522308 RepID=UPI0007865B53|nr:Uma2 family endonuclease [Bacillus niameyensis]